ncbi:GNVR domain-containing protein [uncultured Endozoicomonas sp.]|uniref:GNVR domain-containing protein n=1 Tax=uncultured Endozoicomonas sp. TaxID=432652 RepID=UPI0026066E8C|nr:GNVR domain-containing protein [uncultured Endozoicomonas sp.]
MTQHQNGYQNPAYQDDLISLTDIFAIIFRGKYWIVGSTVIFAIFSLVYLWLAAPVYSSKAMIRLDSGNTSSAIQVIKSAAVLDTVIAETHLDIAITPDYFPVLGKAFTCAISPETCNPQKYPVVEYFELPQQMMGMPFSLQVGEAGEYKLKFNGQNILNGKAGELAHGTIDGQKMSLKVSRIAAAAGAQFNLEKQFPVTVADDLSKALKVSEVGKGTGIISLGMDGPFTSENEWLLDTVVSVYQKYRVETLLTQLDIKVLPLEAELNIAKAALEKAQSDFETFQLDNVTINAAELAGSNSLDIKQEALNNPDGASNDEGLQTLIGMRMLEEIATKNRIYENLLSQLEAIKIEQLSATSDMRVLSSAVSLHDPVKPKKALILVLAIMLGGMVGVGVVFVREMLRQGFRTAEELEQKIGLPVLATVTQSEEEGFRVLRTNLLYHLDKGDNNRAMICAPTAHESSQQVITQLAKLCADAGKKTLLIDADLRNGTLYKTLNIQNASGLTNELSGSVNAVTVVEGLDVIAGESQPEKASEVLMSDAFQQLLEKASSQYDVVLINTPPALAATEAAIAGAFCATNLLVAEAETTSGKEIESAMQRLQLAGIKLTGCVFNR